MSVAVELNGQVKSRILSALPAEEYERLSKHLETVMLSQNQVLHEPEEVIQYIYFINDGIVSLLSLLRDGSTIEIGVAGREGLSDTSALLGANTSPHQALVQIPGSAMRIRAEPFKEEVKRGGRFQEILLLYASLLIAHVSQVSVCNALHTIEERLARWLMLCARKLESDDLPLTQESISYMLGVRRAGVTVAARTLQTAGLIKYNRGHITIIDREGLEASTCECYLTMKKELDHYLESLKS